MADSDKQLEAMAEILQAQLIEQQLIQDRSTLLKSVPQSFLGKDAVTILQKAWTEILKQGGDDDYGDDDDDIEIESATALASPLTREEALEKGRKIAGTFKLFRHATSETTELQDSDKEFYVLDHNLPSQVRRVKNKHKTYWDKMRLLEANVEVKDRKHMFRVFPQCFIAKEAVDVCMDLKLVKSRGEAVHLVNKLNQKVFCCEHVCAEHEFKDDYLFFRFIPKSQRMPEPGKNPARRSRSKSPQRSLLGKVEGTEERAVRKGRPRKCKSFDHRSSENNCSEEKSAPTRRRRSKSPQKSLLGDKSNEGDEPRKVRKGKLRQSKSFDPTSATNVKDSQGGRELPVARIPRDKVKKNRNNSISTAGSGGSTGIGDTGSTKKTGPVLMRLTTVETEHLLRPPAETDQDTKKGESALMRMTTVEAEYLMRPSKEDSSKEAFPKRNNHQRANDVRNRLAALKEQKTKNTTDSKQTTVIAPVS